MPHLDGGIEKVGCRVGRGSEAASPDLSSVVWKHCKVVPT